MKIVLYSRMIFLHLLWLMLMTNPRFQHRKHQAKPLDAELCIIHFRRYMMMCSIGMQSFAMQRLAGSVPHLHQCLSKRVCHMRTWAHLQMNPPGFDLLSILRDFSALHPDRYLTVESDVGRMAWTCYFGRQLGNKQVPVNVVFARVIAEYGHQKYADADADDGLSSLVLAMIDSQQSFVLLRQFLRQDSYYRHIAWAMAQFQGFKVPKNELVFVRLRRLYRIFADFSTGFGYCPRLFEEKEETMWWVCSVMTDAIFALSRITIKGVPNIKGKGNPPMAKRLLVESLKGRQSFPMADKFMVAHYPLFKLMKASTSSGLVLSTSKNSFLQLSTIVQGAETVHACSRHEDCSLEHVNSILFISDSTFVTVAHTEIRFWTIQKTRYPSEGDQYQIRLLSTFDIPRFLGPNKKVDDSYLFQNVIVIYSTSEYELFVIPFKFSENGVLFGKKFTFPFRHVLSVKQVQPSLFTIRYNAFEDGRSRWYSCPLDCTGEEPKLGNSERC